jgi:hypothetical protein
MKPINRNILKTVDRDITNHTCQLIRLSGISNILKVYIDVNIWTSVDISVWSSVKLQVQK